MKVPDKYVIVKIEVKENKDNLPTGITYKLFSTWSGGLLDGDSWKLNSGITKVQPYNNYYLIYGNSNTIYKVYNNIGYSNYTYSVLQEILKNVPGYCIVDIIDDNKVFEIMDSFKN